MAASRWVPPTQRHSTRLDELADLHDDAELAVMEAVRRGAPRPELAALCTTVAMLASLESSEADRALSAGEGAYVALEEYAEASEQVARVWHELAAAYAAPACPGEWGSC